MKCQNCQNEINDSAKFCKFCGSQVTNAANAVKITIAPTCPECGNPVAEGAKFCRSCGAKLPFAIGTQYETPQDPQMEPVNDGELSNYVTWTILPGQLAARIDEKTLAIGKYRGVYVTPGTKALFFEDGKFVASLDGGKYVFRSIEIQEEKKEKPLKAFFQNIFKLFRQKGKQVVFKDKAVYNVIIVRGAEFSLYYDFLDVNTKGIRSNIALQLLCKLTNLNDFFRAHLVDKKMVTMESFGKSLESAVRTAVNEVISSYTAQEVETSTELRDSLVDALNKKVAAIYPYVSISSIVSITAKREEIEQIRKMKEGLYVSELELEQLHDRNTFLNRLQSEEHSHELNTARSEVDFAALMNKVNEDGLLNDAKFKQFAYMLSAQFELANATTDSDKYVALNKLKQSNMLSEEEVLTLKMRIEHNLNMANIQNEILLNREMQKLDLENTDHEINVARKQAEFQDERRNADLDFQKREAETKINVKLDALQRAQAIREEREKAKHERMMEEKRLDAQSELDKYKITSTMSFEQIMASNPNITPEAAAALAKKFEAEAAMANNSIATELQRQHNDDIKEILAQQMAMTKDIINAQTNAKNAALENKQAELDRVHSDSEKNQDRFLSGMQTTINAVASATRNPGASPVRFCPNCGKKHTSLDDMICTDCGTTL